MSRGCTPVPGRRTLAAGVVLAALYAAVVVATGALSDRPIRPLFDGFAPPAPYKWVNPPPGLEKDNQQPAAASLDVPLDANGSMPTNSATPDGQAIAGLDAGSVPAHAPDAKAVLAVKPADPGKLAPLPQGLRPESNAYQVTITYQPSGTPLTTLGKPGTIALTAAAPATVLLYSPDGSRWETVEARTFGDSNGQFAAMAATGYYLSASHNAPRAAARPKAGRTNLIVGLLILAVIAAVLGVLFANRAAERRRAQAERTQRKRSAPAKGRGKKPKR